MLSLPRLTTGLLLAASSAYAIELDINDPTSIKSASKIVVENIISLYNDSSNGFVPGIFPPPYYWWEGGLAWNSLINYWALTGDATYNSLVQDALLFQVGPDYNYMPLNQTKDEGNDDQSEWALAVMTAAELGFPMASSQQVSWITLAENVFNTQTARWDTGTCDGGLRWQIFTFNNGYNYKNALTNGNFFQIAARLARYTGNQTYVSWAQTVADWSEKVDLIDLESGLVYDGITTYQCDEVDHLVWTSNSAAYLGGAAFAYNQTKSSSWSNLAATLFFGANATFASGPYAPPGVLTEAECAPLDNCDTDQLAFRAPLLRALANTQYLLPASLSLTNTTSAALHSSITTILQRSALAAAAQCVGGSSGTVCGNAWGNTTWDGTSGLGQDLSALEAFLANLPAATLLTASTAPNGSVAASPSGTGTSTPPSTGNVTVAPISPNATTPNVTAPSVTPFTGAATSGKAAAPALLGALLLGAVFAAAL